MFPGVFVVRVQTSDCVFPNEELMMPSSEDIKDALWWRLQPCRGDVLLTSSSAHDDAVNGDNFLTRLGL